MASYYAFSVLLSAFLLFQIQPMIGKYILPWFGGTPTVWSTVLLFFQALLTGGYAYAYWLLGRKRGRQQGVVHLIVLGLSLGLLTVAAFTWRSPLTPDASWRPQGSGLPIWDIFKVLIVSVGFPYLLLASNSTLMQGWFNRDYPDRTPYRLYALSNAGSLLALISYPILFEPNLTLRVQAFLWSGAYAVFALATAYLAISNFRQNEASPQPVRDVSSTTEKKRPGIGLHILWVALAACASALLIAVTSQITQEVAVIPFLWILPLTIYLLTFILAFSGGGWYARKPYLAALFIVSLASLWMLVKYPPFSILTQIVIYSLLLFVCCMICHNELYALRPDPSFLPSFYLMVALGGAVGGIFVNLIAPYLFTTGFWELQWSMILCWILLTLIIQLERTPVQRSRRKRHQQSKSRSQNPARLWVFKPSVAGLSAFILLMSAFLINNMRAISKSTALVERNFYGVLRTWEINTNQPALLAYQLTHGKTVHGFQFKAKEIRDIPTTYYTEDSGVGLSILDNPARPGNLRIGALGLGIGILASYGQPGDVFRYYEINPDVIKIAEGQDGYFSFLKDSKAEVQVVPGDARVSLEQELASSGSQNFDLLVLDTFSGDTMPLHLLTKEAFAVYLQHLKPNGIIAVNVSNRYFNLSLEVYRLADEFNLGTALIQNQGDGIQSYDSVWMLLTHDQEFLTSSAIASRSTPRPPIPARLRLWTDDYSNLFQILK